jgi:ABC-type nitrate/sulfonate/bicarbonate transport system permease component
VDGFCDEDGQYPIITVSEGMNFLDTIMLANEQARPMINSIKAIFPNIKIDYSANPVTALLTQTPRIFLIGFFLGGAIGMYIGYFINKETGLALGLVIGVLTGFLISTVVAILLTPKPLGIETTNIPRFGISVMARRVKETSAPVRKTHIRPLPVYRDP